MERADAIAELFGRTVADAIANADEGAREAAEIVVCQEVVRNLAAYVPQPVPSMPHELEPFRRLDISDLRDALRDPRYARPFGQHRYEVTEAESANAQRLQVLCSTVQTLLRLRCKNPNPGLLDTLLETVGTWVNHAWRLDPPLQGDVQRWARKHTYRSDVLPSAWRAL